MWDMERAKREGYLFGAKLVRGAYLDLENRVAKERGVPSPIWADIQHTHANYDKHAPPPPPPPKKNTAKAQEGPGPSVILEGSALRARALLSYEFEEQGS